MARWGRHGRSCPHDAAAAACACGDGQAHRRVRCRCWVGGGRMCAPALRQVGQQKFDGGNRSLMAATEVWWRQQKFGGDGLRTDPHVHV
eukprot:353438-Chlamydomonas_euryale.AAC.18